MYKRRIKIFLAVIALALTGLGARLGHLQIIQGQKYLASAEQYLRRPELLPAMRGQMLDRKGRILAVDEPCFDLCLDYRFMTADEKWISRDRRRAAKAARLPRDARWISARQRRIAETENLTGEQAEFVFRNRWKRTWKVARRAAAEHDVDLTQAIERIVGRIERMSRGGLKDIAEFYQFHPIVRGLGEKEAGAIKAELAGTVGMEVRPSHKRVYPRKNTACHVVGFTGQVNEKEMARRNRSRFEPDWLTWQRENYRGGDMIGKSGVEKMCESILRGQRGYRIYRAKELVEDVPARPGADVHLTIDAELQDKLAEAFVARHDNGTGAIVVLDVQGGEVLALVSIPTYDLNRYRSDFKELIEARTLLPLRHRAVVQACAPGSTVKPVAALAALAARKIALGTKFDCKGGYMFENVRDRWRCWSARKGFGHGLQDVVEGLRHSCNVYFYHVGQSMGPHELCEWYRLFGFGVLPGTGLPEERAGRVPTDEWMRRHTGDHRALSIGDARLMAIGQGAFSATPLQVANAMATIARGGRFLSPALTLEGGPTRVRRYMPMSDRHVNAVHKGMRDVVHQPDGTAHKVLMKHGLGSLGLEFCGKTGTATVPPQRVDSDGDGRITSRDRVVRTGNVAWFAGFAPYGDPQIAFAVMVEYVEGGGGDNAGPIALDVVRTCKRLGYIR